MIIRRVLVALAVVLIPVGLFAVTVDVGEFDAQLGPNGGLTGGGTGYVAPTGEGPWFLYEDDPNGPWWNQWYYDGLLVPGRKEVRFAFEGAATPGAVGDLLVAVNWTTPAWSALGLDRPPLPTDALQGPFIERAVVASFEASGLFGIQGGYTIRPYNPEWVSIDVRGQNVSVQGWIEHTCIPEPATALLLGGGCLALLGVARLRKKS